MTYTEEDVKRLLGYLLNGGRWRRPDAPDDDMPRAKGSPACQGTELAEAVDIRRAWFACLEDESLSDPVALYGAFGEDMPVAAVAEVLGVPSSTCDLRIYRDISRLTEAINRGARPTRHLREYA